MVLSLGRSHRTSSDEEVITWGEPFARVEAEVGTAMGGEAAVEVALARSGHGSGRKRIRVNGVARRSSALTDALPIVLFAPEEMLLVVGSPSLRRATLDTLAAARYPLYGRSLATYGRALQQRNGLLRAIRETLAERDQLPYWDNLIVEEGGQIVARRIELLDELAGPLSSAHREIAPEEGRLSLRYATNAPPEVGEGPAEALRRRLAETAEKELWNGVTLVGPHRDDVVFEQDGRDLASFASRGQQRTAILALKLAQLDLLEQTRGIPPLLLLDDVFSELDPDRRSHLVRRIAALPQAFVTSTAPTDLEPALLAASTAWRVAEGRLEASRAGNP